MAEITKKEAANLIISAKEEKEVSFEQLGELIGHNQVWTAAAILGQAAMSQEEAEKLTQFLNLDEEVASVLQEIPMKGSLDSTIPVDPLIYRFHEVTQVYGTTLKAVIHEMFGDGIMSAIDFEIDVTKKEDPKGDRVVVTMEGKFLPYRKW